MAARAWAGEVQASLCGQLTLQASARCSQSQARAHALTDSFDPQIPASCAYHVVPDPPGCKIGNGGATLVVLDYLRAQYKDAFPTLKCLVIHAGGYSQRTPQHSVCGKIFAPLPVGPLPGSSMLEMCFAMLCDIPPRVAPGAVMIKCGDDVIIFDAEECQWDRPGFTALAHRSTVDIALTHGVFCLDLPEPGAHIPTNPTCRRFTHKPSIEKMRRFRALLNQEREAFTDSTFLFDAAVAARLLSWWDNECGGAPPPFELDAYGDMLQALGPEADGEHLGKASNARAQKEVDPVGFYRRSLFEALRHVTLNVALPRASRFWHIGTIPEVLDHFCYHTSFLLEAAGGREVGGAGNGLGKTVSAGEEQTGGEGSGGARSGEGVITSSPLPPTPPFTFEDGSQGLGFYVAGPGAACSICSRVSAQAALAPRTVLEFSTAEPGVTVGRDSFISSATLPPGTTIPPGVFLQTVALRSSLLPAIEAGGERHAAGLGEGGGGLVAGNGGEGGGSTVYVTHVMGTRDDVKKSGDAGAVTWLGLPLAKACDLLALPQGELWPDKAGSGSLWSARLFPVCADRETSMRAALAMLAALSGAGGGEGGWEGERGDQTKKRRKVMAHPGPRVSFGESIKTKDAAAQQAYRRGFDDTLRSSVVLPPPCA